MKTRTTITLCVVASFLAWLSFSPSKITSAFNKFGAGGAAASVSLPTGAQICGLVSAYTPATAAIAGSIRIGGLTYAIAPGAALRGVSVGSDQCFSFCFDGAGRIARQEGDASFGQNLSQVCGMVTSFTPSVGGMAGSVTIGGAKVRLAPGIYLGSQDQVSPGSNSCLVPVGSGDFAGAGSFFFQNSSPKQVHIPQLVHGRTFGADPQEDIFWLPEPMILSLDSDQASVFTVGPQTFGRQAGYQTQKTEGFSYSTPNSVLQAISCTESLWDAELELASNGLTDGDMVTLKLLNPDKSLAQQIAMFNIQGGGATLTQLHPDVRMSSNGMNTRGVGYFAPFLIWAGNSGLRTFPLTFAFSMTSKSLDGCFQLAVEIKRGSGFGTTSVVLSNVTVKRMERPSDRDISINVGLLNNVIGWYPTGEPCDFVCWQCAVIPPPPVQKGRLSGFVYCDTNDDGVKDSGEPGLAGVEIKLLGSSGAQLQTTKTDGSGAYVFSVDPGTYSVMEVQPTGSGISGDGKDAAGNCGGVVGNDVISNIIVGEEANCSNYNFGELCASTKCDTICWRSTQFFVSNFRYLPGGTVLIAGVNANNPVGIQQNLPAVRIALQGGASAMQRINKEYVTAQLSLAYSGGGGSPVVFNTFWSPLSCSGVAFSPVTLSNGVSLSPSSLLDTLNTQSVLAIKENRHADMFLLADIWARVNGRCGQ